MSHILFNPEEWGAAKDYAAAANRSEEWVSKNKANLESLKVGSAMLFKLPKAQKAMFGEAVPMPQNLSIDSILEVVSQRLAEYQNLQGQIKTLTEDLEYANGMAATFSQQNQEYAEQLGKLKVQNSDLSNLVTEINSNLVAEGKKVADLNNIVADLEKTEAEQQEQINYLKASLARSQSSLELATERIAMQKETIEDFKNRLFAKNMDEFNAIVDKFKGIETESRLVSEDKANGAEDTKVNGIASFVNLKADAEPTETESPFIPVHGDATDFVGKRNRDKLVQEALASVYEIEGSGSSMPSPKNIPKREEDADEIDAIEERINTVVFNLKKNDKVKILREGKQKNKIATVTQCVSEGGKAEYLLAPPYTGYLYNEDELEIVAR